MYTDLFNAEARVCAIYPIALIGDPENPPQWVGEFAEDVDFVATDVFQSLAELRPFLNIASDSLTEDEFARSIAEAWYFARRTGFIVRAEVCLREYRTGSSFFSGWHCVALHCFFVQSVDEIEARLLAIANKQHALSQAKAGAA